MELTNTVLDRRQRLGMTRDELAAKAGVSASTIVALEHGTMNNPKLATMIKIAKALKVNSYWRLFTEVK